MRKITKFIKPTLFKAKKNAPKNAEIIDAFSSSLKELFFTRNPGLKKEMPEARKPLERFLKDSKKIKGIWIYYPWNNKLVYSLPENLYFELRTARNKNLITIDEQKKYREFKVGITGVSIGSNILWPLVMSGGPKFIKIADPDTIEVSNLNRLRAPISSIGVNKAVFTAHQIWEMDPFAKLFVRPQGVSKNNIESFILNKPKLDVLIDEMDSLNLKIASRKICRKNRIPVLMATNIGDKIMLDVERFDLEPKRPILHGLIGDVKIEDLENIPYKEWLKFATKIVDPKNFTVRLKESISEIGKTVSAVPQLGTSATIAGAAISYIIRKIAANKKVSSGRYFVNLDKIIN